MIINKSIKKSIIALTSVASISITSIIIVLNMDEEKDVNSQNLYINENTNEIKQDDLVKQINSKDSTENKEDLINKYIQLEEEKNYTQEYKQYLAKSEQEKRNTAVVPRQYEIPEEEFKEIEEEQQEAEEEKKKEEEKQQEVEKEKQPEDKIPSKFNLADIIDLKVENQSSDNICWCYASTTSLETNLALTQGKYYDFSEKEIDYVTSNELNASLGRNYSTGGDFQTWLKYFQEKQTIKEDSELLNTRYKKQEYHGFDDLSGNRIIITKAVDFPSFKYNSENIEQFNSYQDIVKKHIMNYGSIYAVVGTFPYSTVNLYMKSDDEVTAGISTHAISIVGWDDSYSKNNFSNMYGESPEIDGAYIAMNSWGTEYGYNGFFYISYADYKVNECMSGVISVNKLDDLFKISDIPSKDVRDYFIEDNKSNIYVIDGEEYIEPSRIKDLDLNGFDIDDISWVENFKELIFLDISNTNISNIDCCKNLKYLKNLNISNTKIRDISSLGNLNIEYLFADNNEGIIGYEKLKKLITLSLKNCNIESISNIESLKTIKEIDLSNNTNITDLDKLNLSNDDAVSITLENCNISNLDILNLEQYENISILNLKGNNLKIIDLSNVDANITTINLSDNPIESLKVHNKNINELGLENCNINDLSKISFEGNTIQMLSLQNNPNINNIEEINKITNKEIQQLNLNNCNISDISFLNNFSYIGTLNLSNNLNVIGDLSVNDIYIADLILKNCNIKNDFNYFNLPHLIRINLNENNLKIEDVINSLSERTSDFITITIDDEITEGVVIPQNITIAGTNNTENIKKINKTVKVRDIDTAVIYPIELDSDHRIDNWNINGKTVNQALVYKIKASEIDTIDKIIFDQEILQECNIIYTVEEDPSLEPEEIYATLDGNLYNSVEDIDLSTSIVKLSYGNGVYERITDYEIITSELKEGFNVIKFKKGNLETDATLYVLNNSGEFEVKFKEDSTLMYDINKILSYRINECDFENSIIKFSNEMIFDKANYLVIRPESISELEVLNNCVDISCIVIEFDEYYTGNKLSNEDIEIINKLPNLETLNIMSTDNTKTIEDYIDKELIKNTVQVSYDTGEIEPNIHFKTECNVYNSLIDILPKEYISYGKVTDLEDYYIAVQWNNIKQNYGEKADISLKININDIKDLNSIIQAKMPINEIQLTVNNNETITINDMYKFNNITGLNKLKIINNSGTSQTKIISNTVIQAANGNFQIEI